MSDQITVTARDVAHGGEAVAKADGKTVFVGGLLPGEEALVTITKDKGSWARADLTELVTPSPDRIDPACRHFDSCGGCQWQFADRANQLAWKQSIVTSQLRHLAHLEGEVVRPIASPGPAFGYRNRMDFKIDSGQPALFRGKSKITEPISECLLLIDPLQDLFNRLGDVDGLNSLTIRAGTNTGDLLAIVTGRLPESAAQWDVPIARVRRGSPSVEQGRMHLYEEIAGHQYRITANGFFQNNSWAAAALVELVEEALDPQPDDLLLDAYAGGGLFSVALGAKVSQIIAVETSPLGLLDLPFNLEQADVPATDILPVPFEESEDEYDDDWTIAVVDPTRAGLGRDGVAVLVSARPRAIAYVSCDPASFARDARMIVDSGYSLEWVNPVDMFPQTYHIELVARFVAASDVD